MTQEKQPAGLYDFLYRDQSRFGSFYAQLFAGRLSAIERSSSERRQKDLTGKAGFAGFGGERKSVTDVQELHKEVIDPHDLVTLDVLAQLKETNRLRDDPAAAPHGAILLMHGSIVFIDRGMVEIAKVFWDTMIDAEKQKSKAKRDHNVITALGTLSQVLGKLSIPSSFCFRTDAGAEIVGIIHDGGMSEPISSYYFKHGAEGIPDVYLAGIKEAKTTSIQFPQTDLVSAGRNTAEALSKLIFPENAIRLTPIAVFRKL